MWHRRTIGLCSFSHSPSFWTLGLSSRGWSLEASKPPRCGRFPRSVDGEGGMGKGVPWRVDHHQDFHIHQKSELLRHAGYVFNHVSGSEHYSHILSLVTHTHTKFFFTKVFSLLRFSLNLWVTHVFFTHKHRTRIYYVRASSVAAFAISKSVFTVKAAVRSDLHREYRRKCVKKIIIDEKENVLLGSLTEISRPEGTITAIV